MKKSYDKEEIELLSNLLFEIKDLLHRINRTFFQLGNKSKRSIIKSQLEMIWSKIHTFRLEYCDLLEDDDPVNKIAGQSSRIRLLMLQDLPVTEFFDKEFLTLRRFVEQFEKSIVKKLYFLDTGCLRPYSLTAKSRNFVTLDVAPISYILPTIA